MSKRQKFILTSILLSAGFLAVQLSDIPWRYEAIAGLAGLSILFFIFSLWEGLDFRSRPATLLTLTLPVLFTAGVGLFYFLLPSKPLARLPVFILYGIGIYALSLTGNIFTVAAIRTIQLARAARAVNFVLTLLTAFFIFDTIWSFRLPFYFNAALICLTSFPLFLQGIWSTQLEEKISHDVWLHSVVSTLSLTQIALILSFWPVSVVIASLCLTTGIYVTLGLTEAKLTGRLFAKTVREHLFFGGIFLLIVLLTTTWTG